MTRAALGLCALLTGLGSLVGCALGKQVLADSDDLAAYRTYRVAAEIVGDVFYGAGTREVATPAYPVLSAQLGLVLAVEVLP